MPAIDTVTLLEILSDSEGRHLSARDNQGFHLGNEVWAQSDGKSLGIDPPSLGTAVVAKIERLVEDVVHFGGFACPLSTGAPALCNIGVIGAGRGVIGGRAHRRGGGGKGGREATSCLLRTSQISRDIERQLLLPPRSFPDHWLPVHQVHWDEPISIPKLLKPKLSVPPTTLAFVRAGVDGHVVGYTEAPNTRKASGLNSTSLDRAPAPSKNFVRGKSGYVPFLPGGLEEISVEELSNQALERSTKGLRTVAPGLSRGLRLPGEEIPDEILAMDNFIEGSSSATFEATTSKDIVEVEDATISQVSEIDSLLPVSLRRPNLQKKEWAHVIDVNTPFNNFHELVPDMAHKYPFELDTFQKHAVYHLERGNSVFVAAHTSAGKTVVAEYAIALSEKHMTRAIYTSPIKALSNQKFRDFKQTFSAASVGILTGDVQINPEANCLIMTTEILRSMLYKGADLIRDVEFVIFDEVHYVNDAERGVVWEEVIIMLPEHVSIILLSATVPNAKEFAGWVGRTKKKDIYVISTPQRPVPLEHYLYAGRDMFKIVDAKRNFLAQGYKDAVDALKRKQDKEREAAGLGPVQRMGAKASPASQRGRGGRGGSVAPRGRGGGTSNVPRTMHMGADKNLYVHLVGHLKKKNLLPVVVFTLSKKRCEENASTLTNQDLCTGVEKSEVHVAIEKAVSRLKGTDRKLPQITRMRDLLSRGIGVHHEVCRLVPRTFHPLVEILFARGLVKILFATETFAMGVNMPAKCVVFSGTRKHDGKSFRDILPGEYTQMAGRAGRRGLDPTGTVIIVSGDTPPEQTSLHTMIIGVPGKLSSQFRLTYNMILNLLRVEALRVEEMIKRSFSENASQRLLPAQEKAVVEAEKKLSTLPYVECDICTQDIDRYYDACYDVAKRNQSLLQLALSRPQGGKLLGPGRVVVVRDGHFSTTNLAILLKQAPVAALESGLNGNVKSYFVLALVSPDTKSGSLDVDPQSLPPPSWPTPPESLIVENGVYDLRSVPLTSVVLVTDRSVKVDVAGIVDTHLISRMHDGIAALRGLIEELLLNNTIPEVNWERLRAFEFQENLRLRDAAAQSLNATTCALCPVFQEHYTLMHQRKVLQTQISQLRLALSEQNLELIPDYEQRISVLKDLKFIDDNSTVQLKGRVACEINSASELVLTEIIFENLFASYEPEEVVALLSCFVFQEKTDKGETLYWPSPIGIGRIQDLNKVVADEHKSQMKFGLMEVVYEWAKGMPFEQITALTDVPEGTIVRVITRLDETCREVRDAARVIGDAELFQKMEDAQTKIKRDRTYLLIPSYFFQVVFAASLYF
ncbi:translation repressor [Coprinellus micaceus]|uniref:Translation repressor n=1 Tax=Coprinellus micaceus TaxID=71717 RepID=A0A4Y7TXK9_COPMI|nr:translation repressor [Coprinellus micaceus]